MIKLKCGCEYNGNGYLKPCKLHDATNKERFNGC